MKKTLISIYLITFSLFGQTINTPLVPGTGGVNFADARNEFNEYGATLSELNLDAAAISTHFGITVNWSQPMLMWNGDRTEWPKWTAFCVIAFAEAFRTETNSLTRSFYRTQARAGAEFLLWLEDAAGRDGGIPDEIDFGIPPSDIHKGPFTTGISGIAFLECYRSFGDLKYYNAAIRSAEWHLTHKSFPYEFTDGTTTTDITTMNYRYYSNVNHMARPLWHLSEVYKITGDQRYLEAAIDIAEEIVKWQNFSDIRDPRTGKPWSLFDGSWYWYNYSPTPNPPVNVEINPGTDAGFDANRKMDYHTATVYGLIKLLEVTAQQPLLGYSTDDYGSFNSFRPTLITSIKRAINYIIDQQETLDDSSSNQRRGFFKTYKDYERLVNTSSGIIIHGTPAVMSAPH